MYISTHISIYHLSILGDLLLCLNLHLYRRDIAQLSKQNWSYKCALNACRKMMILLPNPWKLTLNHQQVVLSRWRIEFPPYTQLQLAGILWGQMLASPFSSDSWKEDVTVFLGSWRKAGTRVVEATTPFSMKPLTLNSKIQQPWGRYSRDLRTNSEIQRYEATDL